MGRYTNVSTLTLPVVQTCGRVAGVEQRRERGRRVRSTTLTLVVFIIILSVLVMLLLLLLLLLYWRRLRQTIYHHESSLTKSTASSPLAPPRYVASSQLSSVIDCSDFDMHCAAATWLSSPLKPTDIEEEAEEDGEGDGRSCSDDSVDKPPLLDVTSNVSSPSVSCEQLSSLDCDVVDDDDVTSATRHDDVTVQRLGEGLSNALCRYSW